MSHDTSSNEGSDPVHVDNSTIEKFALNNACHALKLVSVNLPWLSPLAYQCKININTSIAVAAVNRKGEIFVNPEVFASLSPSEATFVIAHELLHIALDTFSRETAFDDPVVVNRAHDYIINDLLVEELHMSCPLGGLFFYGASQWSLEKMVYWMMDDPDTRCQAGWQLPPIAVENEAKTPVLGTLGSALSAAGISLPEPTPVAKVPPKPIPQMVDDVIFHSSDPISSADPTSTMLVPLSILEAVRECLALKSITDTMSRQSHGMMAGNNTHFIQATQAQYQPAWQRVLQRWLEANTPTQRSFARPSRRGFPDTQCILPGRSRTGWTLHIILDTSGSMSDSLSFCLGAIAEYCSTTGVSEVHLLQCDTQVTVDEFVDVEELRNYRIAGFGGSDLSPAMNLLDADMEVTGVIIITDGAIEFPEMPPHYDVLWALTDEYIHFQPSYGSILPMYNVARGIRS